MGCEEQISGTGGGSFIGADTEDLTELGTGRAGCEEQGMDTGTGNFTGSEAE